MSLKVPGVSWVREVDREHSKHRELGGQLICMNWSFNQQLFFEHQLCARKVPCSFFQCILIGFSHPAMDASSNIFPPASFWQHLSFWQRLTFRQKVLQLQGVVRNKCG